MGKVSRVSRRLGLAACIAGLWLAVGAVANGAAAEDEELVYNFPVVVATKAPPGAFEPAESYSEVVPATALELESAPEEGGLLQPATGGVAEMGDDETLDVRPWTWQVLPAGVIYHAYLAGEKESRIGGVWSYERDLGWMWDITLGGVVGLVRYGTKGPGPIEGFQIDMEAAGQPRLDMGNCMDLMAADFRFGVPITYGIGRFQTKLAAYHLSSHLGDEYIIKHGSTADRINYSRNVLVWGNSYYWTRAIRVYGEAGWAFYADGGSEPWEFQFGVEYVAPRPTGSRPVPFVAVNSHLRQEVDYGGNLVVQTGWAWRGEHGQMFRVGMQYYTGKSDQGEFFNQFEDKLGLGMWYDY